MELLGYHPAEIERVQVRAGRATELRIELRSTALPIDPVRVEVERVRLIEPEVALTHDVVVGRELRELPLDRVAEAIELSAGVSDGHFRGGRVGQESYVVDGIEVRNQLEGSIYGFGLDLSPAALEEVEVITGGFGAEYGSALSGVVSFVTRRGDPDRWTARASYTSDHWAPGSLFRGFGGFSASAGGPLRPLGATLFAPTGVAVSPDGRTLYFSDTRNHRIRAVDLTHGTITTFAGTGREEFTGDGRPAAETALAGPTGIAISPHGLLFIADTEHGLVWRTPVR
ncbi:MAG TPA: TonB-dependent receptor plug domain-containing protein [Longimicrobiales bacterium]